MGYSVNIFCVNKFVFDAWIYIFKMMQCVEKRNHLNEKTPPTL